MGFVTGQECGIRASFSYTAMRKRAADLESNSAMSSAVVLARQGERERRADSQLRLDPDRSAVFFDDPFDCRETDTVARWAAGPELRILHD